MMNDSRCGLHGTKILASRWCNRACFFLAAALLLVGSVLAPAGADAGKSVTIGDPKDPASLPQEFQDAYASGARDITIRPGTYLLPSPPAGGDGVLTMKAWSDATISAYRTTLILTDIRWNHNLWELDNCTNVTVEGGTVSQNQISSYQGRVVALGQGPDGKAYADWQPDSGYPLPPDGSVKFPGAINVVDKNTRMLKVGCTDYYEPAMSSLGGNKYRIEFGNALPPFGVGDWFVGRYGDDPFKVHLVSCKNCTIKDLVMLRNGFANVREEGSGGGNHILHCIWALGPKPDGATENPLVTNAADGLHSTGANPGPDIEDCVFQGVLLDDCIAIHGYFTTVVSGTDNTMVIADKDLGGFAIGEPLRVTNGSGFIVDVHATAVTDNGNNTSTITLDQSVNVPAGAKFSAVDRDGPGYKILRCHIGGTRSRGILAKADNGLIADNTITGCGMSAVSLGPEFYWGEANYVHNVTIRNNVFDHDGTFGSGGACVWVHGEGAIGNENIIIENNRFLNDLQTNVQIDWAKGVTITGNRFRGEKPWPSTIPVTDVIHLTNSHDITLIGNKVFNSAVFKPAIVDAGSDVSGIQNNDPSGITAATGS